MATVLVTGAARGIGRATVGRLSGAGWTVLAGVRREPDGKALVDEFGDRVRPIQLDITDPEDLAALPAHLPERLDAVVNNAGVVVGGAVETLTLDELRRQFEINVVGQVGITQAVLPLLRASKGRIVFVSSLSGRISTPMTGAYNASKFAVEGLADALRVELRPWSIPVVLVEPGPSATDMWGDALITFDTVAAQLSAEHRALYARHLVGTRKLLARVQKIAVPVERVSATIERALTAKRPKARYPVDAASRAQLIGTAITPTRVLDAVFARVSGTR
jgi:NAD(P)-dependent dehydrogenase (short-subunit alcohol dehydrogenase family)